MEGAMSVTQRPWAPHHARGPTQNLKRNLVWRWVFAEAIKLERGHQVSPGPAGWRPYTQGHWTDRHTQEDVRTWGRHCPQAKEGPQEEPTLRPCSDLPPPAGVHRSGLSGLPV